MLLRVGDVHDQEILVGGTSQVDARLGELLGHPVVFPGHLAKYVLVPQVAQQLRRILDALEAFALLEGQLVCGALHVVQENIQVVGVDQRPFRRLGKEVLRVLYDVLVQRAGGRHHDQQ